MQRKYAGREQREIDRGRTENGSNGKPGNGPIPFRPLDGLCRGLEKPVNPVRQGRKMVKPAGLGRKIASIMLCGILALAGPVLGMGNSVVSAADDGAPLRFQIETQSPTTGLKAGDQVEVEVTMSRRDGSAAAYSLYAVQLDLEYDSEAFSASNWSSVTGQRPDGSAWIGSWSCQSIPLGVKDGIRVLYTNIGGMLQQPANLDRVNGAAAVGRFLLTVREGAQAGTSAVKFLNAVNSDSQGSDNQSEAGPELTLQIGTAGGTGGGSSGGSGSGSGSTGSSGSSAGSNGSGTDSETDGSTGGSGSGSAGGTGTTSGADGNGASGRVLFSELTDIPSGHWAAGAIEYLVNRGLLSGNEKREFQPERAVSRAEFAQMIVSAFSLESDAGSKTGGGAEVLLDVKEEAWYAAPVTTLFRSGVISGIGEGRFGPEEPVLRQDMAVILWKVLELEEISFKEQRDYAGFSDESQIADYARQPVEQLVRRGLLSGTDRGRFEPERTAVRAEAAAILAQMIQQIEQ